MKSLLEIKQLRATIHLGVTAEERAAPQNIWVDVTIGFDTLPQGCHCDAIDHVIDYASLCHTIQTFCAQQPFALIEAVSYQLVKHLQTWLAAQPSPYNKLWVTICKNPPLDDVNDCRFSVGDGHPSTW